MNLRIRFHEAARDEFREAAQWYERQRQGLGEEFLEAVETLLKRAAREQLPGLAAREETRKGTLKLLLRKFPYAVYYEISGSELFVWAVAHGRRMPGYWRKRT